MFDTNYKPQNLLGTHWIVTTATIISSKEKTSIYLSSQTQISGICLTIGQNYLENKSPTHFQTHRTDFEEHILCKKTTLLIFDGQGILTTVQKQYHQPQHHSLIWPILIECYSKKRVSLVAQW